MFVASSYPITETEVCVNCFRTNRRIIIVKDHVVVNSTPAMLGGSSLIFQESPQKNVGSPFLSQVKSIILYDFPLQRG